MLVPAGERALLAEQVADLPNFLGYWTPDALPESSALPAIANGYVTLGSFNRLAKIGDPVLRRWTAIRGRCRGRASSSRPTSCLAMAAGAMDNIARPIPA